MRTLLLIWIPSNSAFQCPSSFRTMRGWLSTFPPGRRRPGGGRPPVTVLTMRRTRSWIL